MRTTTTTRRDVERTEKLDEERTLGLEDADRRARVLLARHLLEAGRELGEEVADEDLGRRALVLDRRRVVDVDCEGRKGSVRAFSRRRHERRGDAPFSHTRAAAHTISRLFSLRWTTVRELRLRMVRRGMSLGAAASVLANGAMSFSSISASSLVQDVCELGRGYERERSRRARARGGSGEGEREWDARRRSC